MSRSNSFDMSERRSLIVRALRTLACARVTASVKINQKNRKPNSLAFMYRTLAALTRAIDPQVGQYAPYPNIGKPAEARKYVEPTRELLTVTVRSSVLCWRTH